MKKNIIVISAAILLATTPVHATSPYLVINTTDEAKIKELKEKYTTYLTVDTQKTYQY